MGKLSIKMYAALCVLGGEVAYVVCLIYGTTLTGPAAELHHDLFALLPGFYLAQRRQLYRRSDLGRPLVRHWRILYRLDAQQKFKGLNAKPSNTKPLCKGRSRTALHRGLYREDRCTSSLR